MRAAAQEISCSADARGGDDEGDRQLPAPGIRAPDDGRVRDARVREQQRLELGGRNLEAADLDQLLEAIGDVDETVLVHVSEVSGAQPAFGVEDLGGGLRPVEVARHHDRGSGFVERVTAARELAPAEGLETLLRAWLAYIPEIIPVAQALEAAGLRGEEGAEAWHDRMGGLRAAFGLAVERVEDAGLLAEGWTAREATDWIWAGSHLSRWRHLVAERGWDRSLYADRVTRSLLAEILTAAARPAP